MPHEISVSEEMRETIKWNDCLAAFQPLQSFHIFYNCIKDTFRLSCLLFFFFWIVVVYIVIKKWSGKEFSFIIQKKKQ